MKGGGHVTIDVAEPGEQVGGAHDIGDILGARRQHCRGAAGRHIVDRGDLDLESVGVDLGTACSSRTMVIRLDKDCDRAVQIGRRRKDQTIKRLVDVCHESADDDQITAVVGNQN